MNAPRPKGRGIYGEQLISTAACLFLSSRERWQTPLGCAVSPLIGGMAVGQGGHQRIWIYLDASIGEFFRLKFIVILP